MTPRDDQDLCALLRALMTAWTENRLGEVAVLMTQLRRELGRHQAGEGLKWI
jgi:hypothetical protein